MALETSIRLKHDVGGGVVTLLVHGVGAVPIDVLLRQSTVRFPTSSGYLNSQSGIGHLLRQLNPRS